MLLVDILVGMQCGITSTLGHRMSFLGRSSRAAEDGEVAMAILGQLCQFHCKGLMGRVLLGLCCGGRLFTTPLKLRGLHGYFWQCFRDHVRLYIELASATCKASILINTYTLSLAPSYILKLNLS